jgi:amino acid adenylation domain-containing protein
MITTENPRLVPALDNTALEWSLQFLHNDSVLPTSQIEFPSDKCVHHLIYEQAQRTPEVTAVVCQGEKLTYRELNQRSNLLANALMKLGVGSNVPVGICIDRSPEMLVGLLGILKAGGCYIPLDPAYPKDRLNFVLTDAHPPVLLTRASLCAALKLGDAALKILCVDKLDEGSRGDQITACDTDHSSSQLAYIMYTSGSTGQPKGMMINHHNVVNFFMGMDNVLGVEHGVWLAVTSISFDISVLELFWTLARGFTVVIHTEEQTAATSQCNSVDRQSLADEIVKYDVTHFQCTPSLMGNLLRTPGCSKALSRLRKCLIGGEALPASLAKTLLSVLRGDLHNMYGPTETTIWSATHLVRDVSSSIPLGRPIANTDIYIMNDELQQKPTGDVGEIVIGGEGVGVGYLNRPDLTAKKFVPDPFHRGKSARLYRTGDLGQYHSDGTIEFLGRADQQVKLHGHRIELGEIESVLQQHPEVLDCVVNVWTVTPEDKRLAAYVVCSSASATLGTELRRYSEVKLPHYMIPATFVFLEKIPLTPNGKIDRNALPSPEENRPQLDTMFLPPRTQLEETIAEIWQKVLHVDKVGMNDNFFDLGGNSLLLTEAHAKLCVALNANFPIVRFFDHPTITTLAEFLADEKKPSSPNVRDRAMRQRNVFARKPFRTMAT